MSSGFKKILITGVSLLMLAGVSASTSLITKTRADAFQPEMYHSNHFHNNVYYGLSLSPDTIFPSKYLYGQMPREMRKNGYLYGLDYGKYYNKINGFTGTYEPGMITKNPYKFLHRSGQTYIPSYVGYTYPHNKTRYHGHNAWIMAIYINKKDVGHPVAHQMKVFNHAPELKSIRYVSVNTRVNIHKRTRKHRANVNHRAKKAKRFVKKARVHQYYPKSVKSHFTRTDSVAKLRKSHFIYKYDPHVQTNYEIFDKYAPNDSRATVPKELDLPYNTPWITSTPQLLNEYPYGPDMYILKGHSWRYHPGDHEYK